MPKSQCTYYTSNNSIIKSVGAQTMFEIIAKKQERGKRTPQDGFAIIAYVVLETLSKYTNIVYYATLHYTTTDRTGIIIGIPVGVIGVTGYTMVYHGIP